MRMPWAAGSREPTVVSRERQPHPPCAKGPVHPESKRQDLNGFGASREFWVCLECGYEYDAASESTGPRQQSTAGKTA